MAERERDSAASPAGGGAADAFAGCFIAIIASADAFGGGLR